MYLLIKCVFFSGGSVPNIDRGELPERWWVCGRRGGGQALLAAKAVGYQSQQARRYSRPLRGYGECSYNA